MAKPPARKVDAIDSKVFGWMWLIKVYKYQRSAIYRLNLYPVTDTARLQLDYHETNFPNLNDTKF